MYVYYRLAGFVLVNILKDIIALPQILPSLVCSVDIGPLFLVLQWLFIGVNLIGIANVPYSPRDLWEYNPTVNSVTHIIFTSKVKCLAATRDH